MTTLADVVERIRETDEAIAKTEAAMAAHPEDVGSLSLALGSYNRMRNELQEAFDVAADRKQLDVCRYRLFDIDDVPSLRVVSAVLRDFQELVTTVYDALSTGPKQRVATNADARAATAFGVAYTFAGSLGIALTVPNDRLLAGKSPLDGAIETIFDIMRSEEPADIRHYADELGPAPIKLIYQWAKTQAEAGVGSEVQWTRKGDVVADVLLQPPQLEKLEQVIARTSAVTAVDVPIRAQLVGIDSDLRTFHLKHEGADVKGRLADTLLLEGTVELPAVHDCVLRVETVTSLATGHEKQTNTLMSLAPLGRAGRE